MKKHSLLKFKLLAVFIIVFITLQSEKTAAQSSQDEDLKTILESKNYSFTVTHETGGDIALGNYYFNVINDSISAALPYNGNSGVATYTTDDNGINVHTKNFSYQLTPLKNGAYLIKIALKNDRVTRSFSLRVNKKGYAVLAVESINRGPVSFTGLVNGI